MGGLQWLEKQHDLIKSNIEEMENKQKNNLSGEDLKKLKEYINSINKMRFSDVDTEKNSQKYLAQTKLTKKKNQQNNDDILKDFLLDILTTSLGQHFKIEDFQNKFSVDLARLMVDFSTPVQGADNSANTTNSSEINIEQIINNNWRSGKGKFSKDFTQLLQNMKNNFVEDKERKDHTKLSKYKRSKGEKEINLTLEGIQEKFKRLAKIFKDSSNLEKIGNENVSTIITDLNNFLKTEEKSLEGSLNSLSENVGKFLDVDNEGTKYITAIHKIGKNKDDKNILMIIMGHIQSLELIAKEITRGRKGETDTFFYDNFRRVILDKGRGNLANLRGQLGEIVLQSFLPIVILQSFQKEAKKGNKKKKEIIDKLTKNIINKVEENITNLNFGKSAGSSSRSTRTKTIIKEDGTTEETLISTLQKVDIYIDEELIHEIVELIKKCINNIKFDDNFEEDNKMKAELKNIFDNIEKKVRKTADIINKASISMKNYSKGSASDIDLVSDLNIFLLLQNSQLFNGEFANHYLKILFLKEGKEEKGKSYYTAIHSYVLTSLFLNALAGVGQKNSTGEKIIASLLMINISSQWDKKDGASFTSGLKAFSTARIAKAVAKKDSRLLPHLYYRISSDGGGLSKKLSGKDENALITEVSFTPPFPSEKKQENFWLEMAIKNHTFKLQEMYINQTFLKNASELRGGMVL